MYYLSPYCDSYLFFFLPAVLVIGLIPLIPSVINSIVLVLLIYIINSWVIITLFTVIYKYSSKYKNRLVKPGLIILMLLFLFIPIPYELPISYCVQTQPHQPNYHVEFIERCNHYCEDPYSLDYCFHYYFREYETTNIDWNLNNVYNEFVPIGFGSEWIACEDRIYCFLAVPCERFGDNPVEGCIKELCKAGYAKYEDYTLATSYLLEELKISSTQDVECNLSMNSLPAKANWFTRYFNRTINNGTHQVPLCEYYKE